MSQLIEEAISMNNWDEARKLIEKGLEGDPENHWYITRLSLTYYEQFDYARSLDLTTRALELAPNCPLVLWDHAGSLDMLDRPKEAIKIYNRILDRSLDSLAYDECGEGMARARGFKADSLYRIGLCHFYLGSIETAICFLVDHLAARGPGCQSIYPIAEVRRKLKKFKASSHPSNAQPESGLASPLNRP